MNPCPIGKWITGQWSSCSASCGNNGYRQRAIGCQSGNKYVTDYSLCNPVTKPSARVKCHLPACKNFAVPDFFRLSYYEWKASDWEKCNCVTGRRERTVTCYETKPNGVLQGQYYDSQIVIMGPDILFQSRKECQIRFATLKSDRWILRFAISVFCDGSHAVGNHVMYLVVLDIKQEILSVSEENTKSVQRTA